jgi:pimeloyl-ACP methyl ester carboxylesterase
MEAGPPGRRPVLLLHGIGANSLHWRYQLAGRADRSRLIAWNAPGYLLSEVEMPQRVNDLIAAHLGSI